MLARLGEGDRHALASGAAGAADAMHVGLGRLGDIEVDDVGDVLDVEPARRHVGRDEHIDGAAAGALHDAVALELVQSPVQRLHPIAAARQALGEAVDLVTGAAEDEREGRRLEVEHQPEGGHLLRAGEDVGGLAHLGERAGRRLLGEHQHAHRIDEVPLGDLGDAGRQRGGEERGLPLLRRRLENRLELVGEAHVEHLVGLVEHDGLDAAQVEGVAPDVIERAARRGDHDVHAAAEDGDLLAEGLPAVDRHGAGADGAAVAMEGLGDLHGELAGGHQHEHRGAGGLGGFLRELLQEGKGEGGGLAGAGRGLSQEIASLEERRDGLTLDGSGFLVAQGGEGFDEDGGEAELRESRHG